MFRGLLSALAVGIVLIALGMLYLGVFPLQPHTVRVEKVLNNARLNSATR